MDNGAGAEWRVSRGERVRFDGCLPVASVVEGSHSEVEVVVQMGVNVLILNRTSTPG